MLGLGLASLLLPACGAALSPIAGTVQVVPDEYKGATSLEDHWRARRADGHVINADGSLSPAVHQWDRWAEVLLKWVDSGVLYPKAVSAEEQRFLDQENAQS